MACGGRQTGGRLQAGERVGRKAGERVGMKAGGRVCGWVERAGERADRPRYHGWNTHKEAIAISANAAVVRTDV